MEMVLTVIAPDRPGLVEALAKVISAHGGNWVDSAMSRLGGEFAGILRVTITAEQAKPLKHALEALDNQGISVTVKEAPAARPPAGKRARLELVGQDHKGIIRDVSRVLAENNVNVENLNTNIFTGSMAGEQMFGAKADIILPRDLELGFLCQALEEIAGDIMVDIELNEVE